MSDSAVFKKLNLKDQAEIVVLDMPDSFKVETAKLDGVTILTAEKDLARVGFVIAFVRQIADIAPLVNALRALPAGDVVVWLAYPKGSSKRYKTDLKHDSRWDAPLGALGFEGVRMVAIDEDWTAARFRRAEFIKTMKRDPKFAMSKEGKAKTGKLAAS